MRPFGDPLADSEGQEPPYSTFVIHMDNLHDASIQFKIWEDQNFKLTKRLREA